MRQSRKRISFEGAVRAHAVPYVPVVAVEWIEGKVILWHYYYKKN
jgi:hypothetical protein